MGQISFESGMPEIPPIINANEHHMALLFLLDTSGSMGAASVIDGRRTTPIDALNAAMNRFKADVCQDEQTKSILDVAVIEFNSNFRIVQEFSPVEYLKPVELTANGLTYIAEPLKIALDMVTERSRFYRRAGAEPYKPWIVIMTDGMAMDDTNSLNPVIQAANEMTEKEKVAVWALAAGEGQNDENVLALLHKICGRRVLQLEGYDFTGFLDWATKSMRAVSQSSPGEKPKGEMLPDSVSIHDPSDLM